MWFFSDSVIQSNDIYLVNRRPSSFPPYTDICIHTFFSPEHKSNVIMSWLICSFYLRDPQWDAYTHSLQTLLFLPCLILHTQKCMHEYPSSTTLPSQLNLATNPRCSWLIPQYFNHFLKYIFTKKKKFSLFLRQNKSGLCLTMWQVLLPIAQWNCFMSSVSSRTLTERCEMLYAGSTWFKNQYFISCIKSD